MSSIKLADVNAALATVNTAVPLAIAAYNILKGIWLKMHPGATEADYLAFLQTASQPNIDDTVEQLKADGYLEQPDGSWKKPA